MLKTLSSEQIKTKIKPSQRKIFILVLNTSHLWILFVKELEICITSKLTLKNEILLLILDFIKLNLYNEQNFVNLFLYLRINFSKFSFHLIVIIYWPFKILKLLQVGVHLNWQSLILKKETQLFLSIDNLIFNLSLNSPP